METQIEKRAKAMYSAKLLEEIEAANRAKEKREAEEASILESFKHTFEDELPLIKEAGITFSAHHKGSYYNQGYYIKFRRGDKFLYMDYNGYNCYRYEYTDINAMGEDVYGAWPKDKFILFLYEGLIRE